MNFALSELRFCSWPSWLTTFFMSSWHAVRNAGFFQGKAEIFWARLIAAELYSEVVPAGMSP